VNHQGERTWDTQKATLLKIRKLEIKKTAQRVRAVFFVRRDAREQQQPE
jgi:hypothetical protein